MNARFVSFGNWKGDAITVDLKIDINRGFVLKPHSISKGRKGSSLDFLGYKLKGKTVSSSLTNVRIIAV